MKRFLSMGCLVLVALTLSFAVSLAANDPTTPITNKNTTVEVINSTSNGDSTTVSVDSNSLRATGVAVSPSRLRMKGKPGETVIEKIKISNDTDRPNSFKVSFFDFDMNGHGKSQFLEPGEGKYSLSKWASASPTFIELAPGERKEITLTISIPDGEESHRSAWSILMVEQAEERKEFDIAKPGEETIAFGIVPSYAFGVFLYQNPPNVTDNSVDIINFDLVAAEIGNTIEFEIENTGNGISYCTAYIELTNLSTGFQDKMTVKHFTILPELIRDFKFPLPSNLSPGQYSAVGVLDFGSSEEIIAAELEFEVEE